MVEPQQELLFSLVVIGIPVLIGVFTLADEYYKEAREKAEKEYGWTPFVDCERIHKFKRVGKTNRKICEVCGMNDSWGRAVKRAAK